VVTSVILVSVGALFTKSLVMGVYWAWWTSSMIPSLSTYLELVVVCYCPTTTLMVNLASSTSYVTTFNLGTANSGLINLVASGATLENDPELISLGQLV